jgi:DNA polymerase III epsilon subunit-like protein
MKFTGPVISIDVESTGVDPVQDRIVSLSAVKYRFASQTDGSVVTRSEEREGEEIIYASNF